jgi:hypothetical protein
MNIENVENTQQLMAKAAMHLLLIQQVHNTFHGGINIFLNNSFVAGRR